MLEGQTEGGYLKLMLSVDDTRQGATCPTPFNLAQYVLAAEGAPDDKNALAVLSVSGAERWNFGRLRLAVADLAGKLTAAGLSAGDRLLLRLDQSPVFPIAFLAATWCGILPAPTSPSLTEDEITDLANVLTPEAVLAQRGMTLPRGTERVLFHEDLIPGPTPHPQLGPADRPAYVLFTSGTSGTPKPVVHAHRAIWARRFMRDGWTGMTASDRVLHAGAFNWSYTLGTGLFDPWSIGATALVLNKETDIAALPPLAKRHDATIIAAVPGVYRRLLRGPLPAMPKLRHALSAGEKLTESIRSDWKRTVGTEIHEAFGQTECSTFISGSPKKTAPPDSLGYTQPGRAVAILGPDGPVERGEIAEIAISSDDPGLALLPDAKFSNWVRTGDMGHMAVDGAIHYHGRADDILTAGGYRISPLEVERAFEDMPGIENLAAVDYRLANETTVIALFYIAHEPLEEPHLIAHGREKLAAYKLPRLFFHTTHLPTGKNGKLLRRALRAEKDRSL